MPQLISASWRAFTAESETVEDLWASLINVQTTHPTFAGNRSSLQYLGLLRRTSVLVLKSVDYNKLVANTFPDARKGTPNLTFRGHIVWFHFGRVWRLYIYIYL